MGPVMGYENKIWLRIGKGLHVQYLRGYFSGFQERGKRIHSVLQNTEKLIKMYFRDSVNSAFSKMITTSGNNKIQMGVSARPDSRG